MTAPQPGVYSHKITLSQRAAIVRVARYETPDFGVILDGRYGNSLIDRGYALAAPRRSYSRTTGICVRLTAMGWEVARQ